MIYWYGETNNYEKLIKRRKLEDCKLIMSCNDYQVLQTAKTHQIRRKDLLCLPSYAAKNCTSRLAQRVALAGTELNPPWQPIVLNKHKRIVKLAGSTMNEGVTKLTAQENYQNEQLQAINEFLPELSTFGVLEEEIEGLHYELDGCIIKDEIMFFTPIRQHWNKENNKITLYEQYKGSQEELIKAAKLAINAVGLNNSCFCIEFIHVKFGELRENWFVVEINARLGDDRGLAELMCKSGNPFKEVEDFAQEVLRESKKMNS